LIAQISPPRTKAIRPRVDHTGSAPRAAMQSTAPSLSRLTHSSRRLPGAAALKTTRPPRGEKAGSPSSALCSGSSRKSVPSRSTSASAAPASNAIRSPSAETAGSRYSMSQSPLIVTTSVRTQPRTSVGSPPRGETVRIPRSYLNGGPSSGSSIRFQP
jgi:hypothetical protein